MEPNKKIENAVPETAKPAQGGNKTLFWILGGCLVLLVIGGFVVAGIAYWSYKKVKNEIKMKNAAIIQQQKQLEAVSTQGGKESENSRSNGVSATNIPEEPAPVADPGAPSDIFPPAASEKAIGYLKKVYSKGGKDYINIDYAQWLSGDTAEQAMREDGQCSKKGECVVLNDYYIRNQNPLIRIFEVIPNVEIRAHDFEADYASGDWTESMTFSRFSQYFNRNANNGYWNSAPFHVEIGNNKVIKITEQYIP